MDNTAQVDKNSPEVRWNFSGLFGGDDDAAIEQNKQDFIAATKAFVDKWHGRSDYTTEPEVLAEALAEYEEWEETWGTPAGLYYFFLRSEQDQADPKVKAMFNKFEEVYKREVKEIQFFSLRIGQIDPGLQPKFLGFGPLQAYSHFLSRAFAAAQHQLSEAEEKIMLLKASPAHSLWVRMTSEFLDTEEVDDKSFNELIGLISDTDKPTRDQAAEAFNQVLVKHIRVGEAELNAILGNKKTDDELRGFDRPDAARHLSDDIESEVVDVMLDTVSQNFDIPQRFYQLKARLLGLPKLAYHERNVPILGEREEKFEYGQAQQVVREVFASLDQEFLEIYERMTANGQLDVFPRSGKSGGAFCAYWSPKLPTYILLNHTDKLNDVLTIAHEFGHAINAEMIKKKESALNYGTSLATAEVASTFMEDFVLQKLMQEASPKQRLSLIMQKLNDDISTIFRQVACYRFEQELHATFREAGYLSQVEIGEIFNKHMASYMGDAVEQSEGSQNWWLYWSHIRNFFYVYSYSSGLLISKALQSKYHADQSFIIQVKKFLSTGNSTSPKAMFADLGIDITQNTFWQSGIAEVAQLLTEAENLASQVQNP